MAAGLSQEELAGRSRVSITLVGTVERERGHISAEILCKLCLGLETELGSPMLATVVYEGFEALWKDLVAVEERLRKERGLPAANYETPRITEEDLEQAVDSALAEMKKCALLWYRALGAEGKREGWIAGGRTDLPPATQPCPETTGKVRIRMSGQKVKRQKPG